MSVVAGGPLGQSTEPLQRYTVATGCEHTRVRSRPKWTHRLGRGAFLIVTAVSLYLLLPSLVSVFSSWRSLSHLNWSWAGLVLLAECASYVSLWQLNRVALRVDELVPGRVRTA